VTAQMTAQTIMSVLAQTDPTGLSSTTGKLVVAAMLAASLVVLLRWWLQLRRRDKDR
jgi:hypothetical protein